MKNIITEGRGILKFDTLSTNFTWKTRLHLLLEFSCISTNVSISSDLAACSLPLDYIKSRLVMFVQYVHYFYERFV